MKIEIPPKIRTEDFSAEDKDLVDRIAGVYNTFVDQIYSVLNGKVDYDNLTRQIVTLDVTTNATGQVVNSPQIKYNLSTKLKAVSVLNAQNLVNTNTYPISAPWVSWTINQGYITVLNISGLGNSTQFRLTLELVG